MSAAPGSGTASTTKASNADAAATPPKEQKPAAALEEDDEFEDFPVEGMQTTLLSASAEASFLPHFHLFLKGERER